MIGAAAAHHGWGSYDAANPITVAGPILTSKYENPHATITVKAQRQDLDGDAGADLAHDQPRRDRRICSRSARRVSAYGYKSNVEKDEMRAERITVDGKTFELR